MLVGCDSVVVLKDLEDWSQKDNRGHCVSLNIVEDLIGGGLSHNKPCHVIGKPNEVAFCDVFVREISKSKEKGLDCLHRVTALKKPEDYIINSVKVFNDPITETLFGNAQAAVR